MLEARNISFEIAAKDQTLPILTSTTLAVQVGEFVTLFGPNGCGKSTLLNIIAGLVQPMTGEVLLDGDTLAKKNVGFVFQNYQESLFPWMTALENVAFALEAHGCAKAEASDRAREILALVKLGDSADRYPYELSGGMKQLVAICRAMVIRPEVLLLDEPCSALDYATTKRVELDLLALWSKNPCPAICVSHDVDEAVLLADRVVVMSKKPGTIKEIIAVDLPRPRTLEMLTSEAFLSCREKVLKAFAYDV